MTLRTYFTPESTADALELKARHGYDLQVIAGGTLVMPQINDGLYFPELVMGLRRAGMDIISANGALVIGATATMTQIEGLHNYPILRQAAHAVGGWAVRNMATVGGNLFNQAPYGDLCAALLVLAAQVKIQSNTSERVVDLDAFMTGGRQLDPGELVTALIVPGPNGMTVFRKQSRRKANAPAIITVAAQLETAAGAITAARVALGGADTTTRRFPEAEVELLGRQVTIETITNAAAAAAAGSNPITDAVASAWYRRRMVEVQLSRALSELLGIER